MERVMFDNDPNKHRECGKVFRLVFGIWGYRYETETTVFGNCSGFDNISTAVANAIDQLPEGDWGVKMTLTNPETLDVLVAESEDEDPEEWGLENLVSAEIIGFAPDNHD